MQSAAEVSKICVRACHDDATSKAATYTRDAEEYRRKAQVMGQCLELFEQCEIAMYNTLAANAEHLAAAFAEVADRCRRHGF